MRRVLARWLDALLGEECVCGQRVFPRDLAAHERLEHAGDRLARIVHDAYAVAEDHPEGGYAYRAVCVCGWTSAEAPRDPDETLDLALAHAPAPPLPPFPPAA